MAEAPPAVERWVDEVARLTRPDRLHVCDGSEAERAALVRACLATGELIELDQARAPRLLPPPQRARTTWRASST